MKAAISTSDFIRRTTALVGMQISRPWKGYGSTVFLELGVLTCSTTHQRGTGEACISIDWDWRLESDSEIICGSSDSGHEMTECLTMLKDQTIVGVELDGSPPELVVTLSNKLRLRSMAMVAGSPQWSVRLHNGMWLCCGESSLVEMDGTHVEGLTEEEKKLCDQAESASKRWGKPTRQPKLGRCKDCRSYVRLAGSFHFLDYGVCSAADSEFDGRVMNVESGCPKYTPVG